MFFRLVPFLIIALNFNWIFAQAVCDTIVDVSSVANTNGEGILSNPYNPNNLNAYIAGRNETNCASLNLTLRFDELPNDTIFLSGTLEINPGGGIFTTFAVENLSGSGNRPFLKSADSGTPLTNIINSNAPNVTINNIGFVHEHSSGYAISFQSQSDSSRITNCVFHLHNGGAINMEGDSVLIERNFFRNLSGTYKYALNNSGRKVELRSNLFLSSGINSTSHGIHILANSFVGEADSFLVVIMDASSPENDNFKVQHNLFASYGWSLPLINTSLSGDSSGLDSVARNAYRVEGSIPFNQSNLVPSANNVLLPKGLSDYDNGNYPLIQFHSDPSLSTAGDDFGLVPEVYKNFTSNIPGVEDIPVSDIIFDNFTPYDKSAQVNPIWDPLMLVGCFGSFDPDGIIYRPSPLSSLSFDSEDGINLSQTDIDFDTSYYGTDQTLGLEMFYYFSDSSNIIGGDTATLAANGYYWNGIVYNKDGGGIGAPSEEVSKMPVPNSLRTGNPVYVKLVHKNANGFAVVKDSIAIVEVINIAAYPVTDFQFNLSSSATQHQLGIVQISFVAGVEEIDSIGVLGVNSNNSVVVDTSFSTAALTQLTFDDLPQRDSVMFRAFPIGTGGERGTDTLETPWIELNKLTSELVYITPTSNCLPVAKGLGTEAEPFCDFEDGLNEAKSRAVTLIVGIAGSNAETLEDITIDNSYGTDSLTIISENYFETNNDIHPVIRNMTLTRPNTVLSGFIIEKPSEDVPAVTLGAGHVSLDGNILRFQTEGETEGDMVRISGTTETDTITISNNLMFNGSSAVKFAGAGRVFVLNNSFIDLDSSSIALSKDPVITSGLSAVIASNHFSGNSVAHGAPFSNTLTASMFELQRNVFAISEPEYYDLNNPSPALLPGTAIKTARSHPEADLFVNTYVELKLETALSCKENEICGSLNLGASPNYPVQRDLFGRVRSAPNDVGALEDQHDSAWTSGRISATVIPNKADSAIFDFVSLNYDSNTYKYLYIWYARGEMDVAPPTIESSINDSMIRLSSIGPGGLGGLQFSMSVNDLDTNGNVTYTVCQAFGSIQTGHNNHIGCTEFTTPNVIKEGGCAGSLPGQRCPENLDTWGFEDSLYGTVKTYYTWVKASENVVANPISGGSVNAEVKALIPELNLYDSLPYIDAEFSYETTDAGDSGDNYFNISFELPSTAIIPSDLQVYRVSASGRIYFVPSWTREVNGDIATIGIQSAEQGRFYFARGAASTQITGEVALSSFTEALDLDTSTNAVDLNLSGIQFVTSNPLIAVAALPSGSMAGNIFDENYFSKFQIFNTSLNSLGDEIKTDWAYNYFNVFKSAAPDGKTPDGFGRVPIDFNVDKSDFVQGMALKNLGTVVDATTGEIPSIDLSVDIKNGSNTYPKTRSQRKITRGLEFVVAIFDAGKVSYSRVVAPIHFEGSSENALQQSSGGEVAGTSEALYADLVIKRAKTWELFSYPWAEEVDSENMMLNAIGSNVNKWDKYNQRVARWDGSKYIEYDGEDASGFKLDKGKAIWVAVVDKSKNYFTPRSNGGQTLDHGAYTIPLIGGVWNDFGIPFNFPVNLGDVRVASGSYTAEIWEYDPENKSWLQLVDDTTSLYPWKGYTTKPAGPQSLVFPNVDNKRSDNPSLGKRKAGTKVYELSFDIYNSSATQHFKVGLGAKEKFMGKAPMVPGQNFSAQISSGSDENKIGQSFSIKSFEGNTNMLWPLEVQFEDGSEYVYIKRKSWLGPDSLGAFIWDAKTNAFYPMTGSSTVLKKESLEGSELYLGVGSEEFAGNLMGLNVHEFVNYPNPFSARTHFKYSLPPVSNSANVSYLLNVRDVRGKLIRQFKGKLGEGNYQLNLSWDGKDALGNSTNAGPYLVQLKVNTGSKNYSAVRKVIKVR